MTTGSNFTLSEQVLKSLCPAVRDICDPISNYLSIGFFRYVRSYPNRSKFILCSDENWLTEYFKDKLYDSEYANYHKIPKIGSGISVHGHCTSTDPVCSFWNKMSDSTNYKLILALYEKYDTHLEFYNFGIKDDSHAANNIFLNNHSIFHHFILHFRENAQMLFQKAELVKFLCKETDYATDIKNNWMLGLPEVYEKMVVDQMPVSKIYLDDHLSDTWLTREEGIFSRFLLTGYHISQIPEKMKISPDAAKAIINSLITKLKIKEEKDIRMALVNNRIQKKLTFIK